MNPFVRTGAAMAALLTSQSGIATAGREPDLCLQTARAARNACENESQDDFWIATGLCANEPGEATRSACRRTAKTAAREARGECSEQSDARKDLCEALGPDAYAPDITPARFVSPQAAAGNPNRYLPLVPGTEWVYRGGDERVTVTVTNTTKVIAGVTCTVVRDVVDVAGVPVEDTLDYFAQDIDGTVWYFGELVKNFEDGELVDLDGSFAHGVDGAKAGIVMLAAPTVGVTYRQEFALGDAEDAGEVVSTTASATVPGASCSGTCLQTRDFTPIEPGHEEHKFYVPGIGLVLEVNLETGERTELMSFTAG